MKKLMLIANPNKKEYFKSLETLTIQVKPTGCNTSGNKGPFYQNIQMLIFFKI